MVERLGNITDALAKAIAMRKHIRDAILELPDNPNIHRLGSDGKCYALPFSQLGKHSVLSAEFYDFKVQYRYLAELLDTLPLEKTETTLREILRLGRHKQMKFHPDVIENLRRIL